ncbi:MAG: glycosyltransferase family 39 protein [Anaerolineae bacterium]|nr:glycosyltransferase family 39 protein [Anaerolineae bacterium]
MSQRRILLAVGSALVLLGFALRVFGLDEQSLWYDEGYSVWFVQAHAGLELITRPIQLELNTPLYYLLLKAWLSGAGQSEFAVRSLSAAAGLLWVALVWATSHAIWKRPALAATVAVAFSAAGLTVAQEGRMYAVAGAGCSAAGFAFAVAMRRRRAAWWAAWGVLGVLAFASHVLCALVIVAQIAVLWIARAWQRCLPSLAERAATTGLAAWMLLVVALILPNREAYGTVFDAPADAWLILQQTLAAQILPRLLPESLIPVAALATSALIGLALVATVRSRCWSAFGFGSAALLAALGFALFSALVGKFSSRYPTLLLPLVMAWALGSLEHGLPSGWTRFALAGLVALASELGIQAWRTQPIYANEDFRGATAHLRRHMADDEKVVLVSGHFAPVFAYYWTASDQRWVALPNDVVLNVNNMLTYAEVAPRVNAALAGTGGAWLLLWQDDVIDPTGLAGELLRRQSQSLGPVEVITRFHGLRLIHYRFFQPYQPTPTPLVFTSEVLLNRPQMGLGSDGCGLPAAPTVGAPWLEVWCLWRVSRNSPLPAETQVSLRLERADGARVAQLDQVIAPRGLPSIPYPKPIWAPYFLPLPRDASPGEYVLWVVPYTASGEVAPQVRVSLVLEPQR